MKELNCKLIVSDFDGTLANSQNGVDKMNTDAINSYVAAGGIFAVCTGRILASILPRVRGLGLSGLVVACQGSVIAEIASGKIIRNVTFTSEQTSEICKVLEEEGTNVQIYDADGFYTDLPDGEEHVELYERIIGVKAKRSYMPYSRYVLEKGLSCHKVATLVAPKEQKALFDRLTERLGDKYDVTCSAAVLIEISPMGETKGTALKYLADYYNIPIEKTCAIGDNLNDLSMLQAAGYGVAVGNSAPLLKQKVKLVTVTNDEGAVAKVIADYGYING